MGKKLNSGIDNTKLKVLVCCHKPCELPPDPDGIFLPIQVGAAISDINLGIQRDDQVNGQPCDNISVKNKSFCELTAMYWAWKNIKTLYPDLEYIGLNHYRRYFSFDEKRCFEDYVMKLSTEMGMYKLNLEKLNIIFSEYSIVIPIRKVFSYSLDVDYSVNHISEDLRVLKKVIQTKYPEYDEDLFKVMEHGNKLSAYNMMIMKWSDFDSYCSWLFDILFEVEKIIDISKYNDIQQRVFGYMAERLLNVWIAHNIGKKKYLNVILFGDQKVKRTLKNRTGTLYRFLKTSFSFVISNL